MFAKRLNIVLRNKDISQVSLSEKLGLTSASINRWCKDKEIPDNKTILKITSIL